MGACVAERGDQLALVDAELADLDAQLAQLGLQLSTGVRSSLQSFYTKWGDIEMRLQPATPIPLMGLVLLKPEQWEERLGMLVLRDGQLLPGPYVRAISTRAPIFAESKPEQTKDAKVDTVRYRYEYQRVAPQQLTGHLGRQVRITTQEGLVRRGRLYAAGAGEASVEQRLSGGRMVAHIPLRDIRSAEVRVAVRVEPEEPEEDAAASGVLPAPERESEGEHTGQAEASTEPEGQ
jgi:hypothetical protein